MRGGGASGTAVASIHDEVSEQTVSIVAGGFATDVGHGTIPIGPSNEASMSLAVFVVLRHEHDDFDREAAR